jgi:hypothetical protein
MPKQSKRKNISKGKKAGTAQIYSAPRFGDIKTPFTDYTLELQYSMQAGVIGTNGYITTVAYASFAQLAQFLADYKYFEILGFQVCPNLSPQVTTFYEGAVAFLPINANIGEVAPSAVPTGTQQLMKLPGAVWLQPGTSNIGKWFKPPSKQVYSLVTANTSQNVGIIAFYVDNVGAIERVGDMVLKMNVRLYGTQYNINN